MKGRYACLDPTLPKGSSRSTSSRSGVPSAVTALHLRKLIRFANSLATPIPTDLIFSKDQFKLEWMAPFIVTNFNHTYKRIKISGVKCALVWWQFQPNAFTLSANTVERYG